MAKLKRQKTVRGESIRRRAFDSPVQKGCVANLGPSTCAGNLLFTKGFGPEKKLSFIEFSNIEVIFPIGLLINRGARDRVYKKKRMTMGKQFTTHNTLKRKVDK